ncbi:MAG: hypothetical protein CL608_30100 [Anaerolineaceae bacterium]|nr:hypothetical protein [Anaerolineaceae bacterium]
MTIEWLSLSAETVGRTIAYHPNLNQVTGSVLASLLLRQIVYRWENNARQPFYKFSAPCQHPAYRTGDSWQEELGFSRTEFETARRRLGGKIRQGAAKAKIRLENLILYWTDRERLTWYELNEPLLQAKLQELSIAEIPHSPGNAENLQYPELPESCIPYSTKKSQKKKTERDNARQPSFFSNGEKQQEVAAVAARHPAIQAWRQALERYPRKQCWPLIVERLGEQPDSELLAQVTAEWLASGYKPNNVSGILDWYERGRSPERRTKGQGQPLPSTMAASIGLVPTPPTIGGRF